MKRSLISFVRIVKGCKPPLSVFCTGNVTSTLSVSNTCESRWLVNSASRFSNTWFSSALAEPIIFPNSARRDLSTVARAWLAFAIGDLSPT